MPVTSPPSALITDKGRLLRVSGRLYELTQAELRRVLGLPEGPMGLGITIDKGRVCFEFTGDQRTIELTPRQLHHRLSRRSTPA
jgi:hypothetical protein